MTSPSSTALEAQARPQAFERPPAARRTKIVATLGPATSTLASVGELFRSGVDMFRLNFSHGSHEDHAMRLGLVREVERQARRPIAVLGDIQGPKLRIGRLTGGHIDLRAGQELRLDNLAAPGDGRRVELAHPEIIEAAAIGTRLLVDDGRFRLDVVRKGPTWLETKVVTGGRLTDRKGVNVPGVLLPISALTAKDLLDIEFALSIGVDYIGLSFVQRHEDVAEARRLIGNRAAILSKIEKPQALHDLEAILDLSDAVMVARGDLGVELPPEDVPLAQKRIVRAARRQGKPVIVATQMLESMISSPTPTRAEASDVATAVFDGADAVMLSAETATGQYPNEAVAMMNRIAVRVEADEEWRGTNVAARPCSEPTTSGAIATASRSVAETIGAKAIAAFSQSGSTVLRVARERPACPILGVTTVPATARRLAVVWGVHPIVIAPTQSMAETVERATTLAKRHGFAARGDEIVVVAGAPFGQSGTTNALRVAAIGPAARAESAEPATEA